MRSPSSKRNKEGTQFLCYEFIQIENVISQLIFEISGKCFSFQLSLKISIKNGIKNWEIRKFKSYVRMTSANVKS